MKIALLIVILGAFGYCGFQIKDNLKSKRDFYDGLIEFCNNYKREINFLKIDVKSIIEKCSCKNKYVLSTINLYFNKSLVNVSFLSEQENLDIKNFLAGLGKQDIDGEINHIDFYISKFSNKLNTHTLNFNKYGQFSIKMSAILGLLVCILLI